MKILTILSDSVEDFDARVNMALGDGYILTRRGPEQVGHAVGLYAELYLPDALPEEAPGDLNLALHTIARTCATADECGPGCPLFDWCERPLNGITEPPKNWETAWEEADA